MAKQPGPLLTRWESIPGIGRFAITFVVLSPIFFIAHDSLGTMSTQLAIGYGALWGGIFGLLGLWATRTEQTRRRERDEQQPGE